MLEQSEISTSVTEVTTIKSETVVNGVHAETGYSSENSGQENVQNPLLRAYSEPDLLSASSDDRQVKADDAFPFPIFFKRSKKDPGSKLHDALVEELSSVLQKRKLQKRSSGLWEVDEESNETKYKSIREQRQQERSAEKITSVFANKELLSRLESHFAGKIQSQKQANSPQPKEEKSVNGSRRVGTGVNVVETKSVVHVNGAKNFETGEYGKSFNEMPNESNNGNDSSSSASDSLIGRDSKNTSIIVSKTREITFGGEESDSDGGHGYRSFTLGGRGHRNFHASDSNRSQTLDRSYKHVTKINVSNGHVSGNIPDHKHKHDDDYHHQNVHRHNSVNIRVDSFHDNHHHDHHHRDNYHHGNNGHDNYGPVYSTMVGRDGHIERQTSFNSSSKITRFERASIKSEDGQVSRPSSFVIRRGHASDPESDEPTWRTIVDHRNVSQTLGNSGSWVTLVDQSANSAKESDVFRSNSQRNVKKVHNLGQTDQKLVTATAFSHDNDTEVHITAKDNNQQKMYVVKLPSSQALSQPIRTSLSSPLQMSMSTPIRTSMSSPIRSSTLKYGGSPFTQEIGEGALPTAHGDGLYRGEEDKPATFYVEASGMTGEPNIQVDGPNSIAKCSIDPQPGGRYAVTYVPVETGLFDITVKWNGREIHGSPFHPKIVDARKVRVIGGWQHYMDSQERIHLNVGEEKRIPFETAEAGPGKLTAEVRGPSGAIVPCTVDDGVIGKSTVIFTPREEGNHFIHLNWSDHPLSSSPFTGYAVGGHHDITKIILSGRGLKEATVREEAEFFIDGSKAGRGNPEVQLTGVRAEVNVVATPLGGGKYRCTYIPVIPGAYLLHITWNGRQVKGAPFKVNVIGAFYPNKVVVSGEGLKGGLMGRDFDVRIDTRKAGPGELTAFCSGPNKVAFCDLEDNRDGTFRLIIRPTEPGRHVLQVKYGGEHVLGSPFVFRVSAQPDASKVRVSGPGVEHGILATFQSRFIVETRGAGAGQLMVRIRGPKGAFQVEMYRDSQKDRTILCRYDPTETGLYIIHIRWSNVDVPGSPFHVHIVDTQQELEQVLQDQSYSSSTLPSARSYNQWRDEF